MTFDLRIIFAFVQNLGRVVTTGILTLALAPAPAYPFTNRDGSHENEKSFTYRRVILTGVAMYHRENICIAFASFLTSGDFFEGLRPSETATGRKFFRGSNEVKEFPSELTVEVQAVMHDCSKFPPEPLERAATEPFMTALTFKANWKTGLKQRPVEKFSLQISPPDRSSWVEHGSPNWRYDLTIRSSGVSLTDHLVVEVYSETRQFLSRMSVHL
jgi:hypothetical protein